MLGICVELLEKVLGWFILFFVDSRRAPKINNGLATALAFFVLSSYQ
ncbi:hypothetical protein SAMN05421880_11773 [Nitrosomonas nitrosa]|uniref:Uncharacterized protein n=1 Tax=Nitrosomonas nitrosa TaxID=52442 RepID=A0A1I4R5U1_9PROT|nr:hypothetical protein SAMN05421880_11773 [Nitrosomonas nitrosa]